jgi:hypothetical protein
LFYAGTWTCDTHVDAVVVVVSVVVVVVVVSVVVVVVVSVVVVVVSVVVVMVVVSVVVVLAKVLVRWSTLVSRPSHLTWSWCQVWNYWKSSFPL